MGENPIRLNLGCGNKIMPGYINCDLESNWSTIKPDVVCDVTKPLPFPDNHADEILAVHVVEHIHLWEVPKMLEDWMRVLKPGGAIDLEMPCMEKILLNFFKEPLSSRKTFWGLFGDPGYENPDMVHKWCYSVPMIMDILERVGFREVQHLEPPRFHFKDRDMRVRGQK